MHAVFALLICSFPIACWNERGKRDKQQQYKKNTQQNPYRNVFAAKIAQVGNTTLLIYLFYRSIRSFKIISFTTAFCTVVFIFVVAVVYLFCFFTFHFFLSFHFWSMKISSTMVKANRTTCVMCWICTSVAVFLFVSFMTRCLFIAVKTMI